MVLKSRKQRHIHIAKELVLSRTIQHHEITTDYCLYMNPNSQKIQLRVFDRL